MTLHAFNVSREYAADKLNVSIRTIDRYIRRGFLEVKRFNRNVYITAPSFKNYYQEQVDKGVIREEREDKGYTPPAQTSVGESVETIEVSETDASEANTRFQGRTLEQDPIGGRHAHTYDLQPVIIYKGLYEELKEKYEEQIKRLEGAHYRVGQLEAQLKNMVPLLEFRQERKRLELMDQQYKDDIRYAKVRVIETKRLVDSERFNKNVYIALVYGMLALQPVFWVLLQG